MPKNKTDPPPPPWFKRKKYSRLEKLDPEVWYHAIAGLYRLPALHELGLIPNTRGVYRFRNGAKYDVIQIRTGIVRFVDTGSLKSNAGIWIPLQDLPVLIVDPLATDKDILSELKPMLAEARAKYGSHPRKSGQSTLNSDISTTELRRWRDAKIVQFAELLSWRHSLSRKMQVAYPERLLGEWVGRCTTDQTNETKKILKAALNSFPALTAKVEHTMRFKQ